MPYSNEEISKMLGEAAIYGDNSLLGDYRNAQRQLWKLDALHNTFGFTDPSTYGKLSSGLRNQMGTAMAGSMISGLSGLTGIVNNTMQAAQIQDTTGYENQLADYIDRSNYNFVNYDQLANDMSQNQLAAAPSYGDIRGMTNGQALGSIGTSALQGAKAGYEIGGLWGGLIGGLAGVGAGIYGVGAGDKKALQKQQQLNTQTAIAKNDAFSNYQAAHERIGNYNFRSGVANAAKAGGQIDRKKAISSFTDSKLRSAKAKEHTPSNVTRIQKDGGTVYRVRVK